MSFARLLYDDDNAGLLPSYLIDESNSDRIAQYNTRNPPDYVPEILAHLAKIFVA